ncbi:ABC transporter permease [Fulvivirga sp. 29W222]|uniref:ABC transporter permease n=1 Tax=Fulvivirga marina TaxID=2494733 RepID=A0A937FZV5_9BACT|nr:ABC transporter permease [Fulvivirga marina]MBL6447912.1 ABC transporter permease [Fulvivirga marina]
MLQNYLRITIRNLQKNKWYSLINIIGLTIGITASLIIFVYINQELSFDKFHEHADRVYRVIKESGSVTDKEIDRGVPYPMIGALKSDFTEFEASTLYHSDDVPLAVIDHKKFVVDHVIFADSNFFDVFSFKVISGNPKKDLGEPNKAFLTKSLAEKFFDDEQPIGKKIRLRNKIEVEVAGLIEDTPPTSHLRFDMMVSYPTFTSDYMGFDMFDLTSWEMTAEGYAYVKLKPTATVEQAHAQFEKVVDKNYESRENHSRRFLLQPLLDIHFNQEAGSPSSINPTSLWALGTIGLFILLIACVNFINLSTALAVRKSKEVGVRKALGAGRPQLIRQYLADTFIVTLLSGLLAVGIAERMIILFNQFFEKELTMNLFDTPEVIAFVVVVVVVVALLSGLYPALILSGYNPVKALKNNIHSQSKTSLFLRKGLITVQFFISQVLIISTIIISSQMDYFTSKPLGFDKDAIITINVEKNDPNTLEALRSRLMSNAYIENVSFALGPPISNNVFSTHYYQTSKGRDQEYRVQIKPVDYHYLETYGIKLKYGRWFLPGEEERFRDVLENRNADISYILNETAVRKLGFNDPQEAIGVRISTGVNDISAPIVGIVEDYHLGSFHEEIMPAVMMHLPMFYYNAGIKIASTNMKEAISHVEDVHTSMFPDNIFEYDFLDDDVRDFYVEEQRTFTLFKIFSSVSIFISCLGLLGLISFIVNQRTKEVGVRKVLGAGVGSIIMLFSKDFMLLVLMAFLLATPAAWYAMNIWLADFVYQIDMQVWFFALAIVISGVITFVTIGYQSYQAAVSNPVNALRDE